MQVDFDRLRERYDFDSWGGVSGDAVLGWRFRLNGREFPGWAAHRIQFVELDNEPAANLSVWRPLQGNGALVAANVYECDDRAAARLHLLRLLGEFQGADLVRLDGPGDVAFASGPAGIVFARDNFVGLVRNIERVTAPVAAIANRLDSVLTGQHEPADGTNPTIARFSAASGNVLPDQPVALYIESADPTDRTPWFRLATTSGHFAINHDNVIFTPSRSGTHDISLSAIGPGGISERVLQIGLAEDSDL